MAPTVKVTIDPLTKEMLDSGDKFALPVAITAVSYTHLDVYKRQHILYAKCMQM